MSESPSSAPTPVASPPAATTAVPHSRGPSVRQLSIVVGIMAAGILLTVFTADVTKTSEPGVRLVDNKPFLIDHAGGWQGGALEGLSKEERDILPKDTEGARRLYKDSAGDEIFCSVVLAGRDVTSIHRPEMCLPGQGWTIQGEAVAPIKVPQAPGGVLNVMRMNAVRSVPAGENRTIQARSIFVYWFVGKHRTTPYHWQRIFWNTRDRVLHNTNHRWAYILIHVPVSVGEDTPEKGKSEEHKMQLVGRFVQDVYPSLVAD